MNKKLKSYLLALFAMFLWGSAFPVLKLTYQAFEIPADDYYSKLFVAGIRFLLAGILVLIYLIMTRRDLLGQFKTNWKFISLLGLISTTVNYLFFYIGIGNTSGIKSAILQSGSTFLTVILAVFILKESLTKAKLLAVLVGFLGIIISNLGQSFDFNFTLTGEGFMLIAAFTGAFGAIYVKKYGQGISSMVMTSGQMIIGSLVLLILGIWGLPQTPTITLQGVLLLLYSSLLSALAFSIWYGLLQKHPASELSMLRLFIPVFGALLSSLILGEPFTLYNIIGLIFVALGVYIVNKGPSNRK